MDGREHRSRAAAVALDPARPYKPLDVGNGIVAGTITPAGRWLSLGIAHPRHGRIVLTTAGPFDDASRYDAAAVRAYRAALASPDRPSAGLDLGAAAGVELDGRIVRTRLTAGGELLTVAPLGRRGVVQVVRGLPDKLAWTGDLRLDRAAYTQLTEGGPLAAVRLAPRSGISDGVRWIEDPGLGAAAAIATGRGSVGLAFGPDMDTAISEAQALSRDAEVLLEAEDARGSSRPVEWLLDTAACETAPGRVAILADPEILPLVWTRDAYYVARALLAAAPRERRVRAVVDGYLAWQFETAARVDRWWPRASLASGQPKDPAFQLDQQLYPLLLVAEVADVTGDRSTMERYGSQAETLLDSVLARADATGLIATTETPADDRLAQPYHLSSHLLLWRTLRAFGRDADPLRARIRDAFTDAGRFAYAVAGPRGHGARHYHDANDVPTALAPAWGFCARDDPIWRATIDRAWTEANEAFVPGPFGGLGSLHTPHPWPLGDLQRVIVARATGADAATAWTRLDRVSTWDGLLPEAYDERGGSVASRHWFAWPVALRLWLESDPALGRPTTLAE